MAIIAQMDVVIAPTEGRRLAKINGGMRNCFKPTEGVREGWGTLLLCVRQTALNKTHILSITSTCTIGQGSCMSQKPHPGLIQDLGSLHVM